MGITVRPWTKLLMGVFRAGAVYRSVNFGWVAICLGRDLMTYPGGRESLGMGT